MLSRSPLDRRYLLLLIGLIALTSLFVGMRVLGEDSELSPPVPSAATLYGLTGSYQVGVDHLEINVDPPLELTAGIRLRVLELMKERFLTLTKLNSVGH